MTPVQIRLLRRSFDHIAPISDRISHSFYERLFAIAPETRGLFGRDEAAQQRLFLDIFRHFSSQNLRSMLTLPVTASTSGEISAPDIVAFWRSQIGDGVRPEHFALAGHAFAWSLEEHLGGRIEPEIIEAWVRAFEIITGAMVDAMDTGATSPVLPESGRRALPEHSDASLELLFEQ